MTRAQSIALVVLSVCAVPARAELLRAVFPVPPVVDAAFRSGGLAAFDPFDSWQGGNARPAMLLTPSAPSDDAARLPAGACYDVLPAWTARGFKPHDGTRVLYHPQTQLLFTRIAPEDETQVRAFCEWPPAMWMSTAYWGESSVRQVLYRVTSYEVPATGPGGWNFQPSTVEELLALPADAHRILQRQSFVIRGGQRSKVEGYATRNADRIANLTGMIVEAECTVGEDGSTIDLNNAPQLTVRLDDGTHAGLSSNFQHLIEWGNSWLLEAGTLPGNPPRRIFQAFETLRVHGELRDSQALARCRERWTGRAATLHDVPGRAIDFIDFPPPAATPSPGKSDALLPPPAIRDQAAAADPFAAPIAKQAEAPASAVNVPELFGDVSMQDISGTLSAAAGTPSGQLQAWRRIDDGIGHGPLYIRGTPDGMAALTRWLERDRSVEVIGTSIAEVTVRLLPPDGTGERKTIWRSSIPVRSGQRSGSKFTGWPRPAEAEAAPPACEVEMEATREDVPGPEPVWKQNYVWSLTAAATLRPPLVEAPVTMEATQETGTHHGVVLCRAIGRTAGGEDIVITIHLRETEVRTPWWSVAPLHDWWWQHQLETAGK